MKHALTFVVLLTAGSIIAAETTPVDTVNSALASLKAATNYAWKATTQIPDAPFEPGPVKGSTEQGGYSMVSQQFNDNTTEVVFKGDKAAVKAEEGWQNLDDAEGPAAMMGGWLTASGTAADEASKLLKGVKELKSGGDNLFTGDLTPEAAKELMSFKPRRGQQAPPPPKDAKGSAKFWVKDGALTKFESHLSAKVAFGQDQDEQQFEITRTVEIQNVGTTKVDVPADAKKKLESK
jgi:hypothetical protein